MKRFIIKGEFEFEVEAETYEDAIEETNDRLNLSNIEFEVEEEAWTKIKTEKVLGEYVIVLMATWKQESITFTLNKKQYKSLNKK